MNNENEIVKRPDDNRKEEIIKKMSDIELQPFAFDEPEKLSSFTKIPFSRIAAAGTGFDSIAAAFHYFTSGGQATTGIYHVTVPNGGELMSFNDGSGFLGAVKAANGGVGGGQARLNPLVVNPATLCMAVTMINIDKKLDKIQELQQEMFDYIQEKDKAELRGTLNFLMDVINNYKYNWNNETYKQAHLIKAQDIKQSSEGDIEFYRSRIKSKMKKRGLLQSSSQVTKQLKRVEDSFNYYALSLYLYAFSSFLEIMLLENFDSAYLNSISAKIDNYSLAYRELYTESYDTMERNLKKTVEGHLLGGLAKISDAASDVLEDIPILEKAPLDEGLEMAGEKLSSIKSRGVSRRMKYLIAHQNSQVKPFIDSIHMIDSVQNKPLELVFDNENIYLAKEA